MNDRIPVGRANASTKAGAHVDDLGGLEPSLDGMLCSPAKLGNGAYRREDLHDVARFGFAIEFGLSFLGNKVAPFRYRQNLPPVRGYLADAD